LKNVNVPDFIKVKVEVKTFSPLISSERGVNGITGCAYVGFYRPQLVCIYIH